MSQQTYVSVTPGSTSYTPALSAIWCGTGGNVSILGLHDTNPVTLVGVPAGQWIVFPYPVIQIPSSGTTASGIIGAQAGGS
jgi:hypothetical protein